MAHPLYEVTLDDTSHSFADEDTSISYEDDSMLMPSPSFAPGSKPDDIPNDLGSSSLAAELAGALYDTDDDEEYEEDGDAEAASTNSAYANEPAREEDDSTKRRSLGRVVLSGSDYDGSEYGDPDDLGNVISAGLEDKINQIEALALRSRHALKEEEDGTGELAGVVQRLMEGLQNLPSQSSLETGSTRFAFPVPRTTCTPLTHGPAD